MKTAIQKQWDVKDEPRLRLDIRGLNMNRYSVREWRGDELVQIHIAEDPIELAAIVSELAFKMRGQNE